MSKHDDYSFDLYRLTINDTDEKFFEFMGLPIQNDNQILSILEAACNSKFDHRHETQTALYTWGLRDLTKLEDEDNSDITIYTISLARATIEKDGVVFTPDTIQPGTSISQPPPAEVINLIIHLNRHLVAVEYRSTITDSGSWLIALHDILKKSSISLSYSSTIELQEKPKKEEILKTFYSFSKLTRIKVYLLLPNPELSRFTQNLYDDLSNGGIRDFIVDMRNSRGLSKAEGALPHAAAAMAEDGYKRGDVTLEGIRENRREIVKTGKRPARGKVDGLKQYVRGLSKIAKTKEGKTITSSIIKEINRIADEPESQ